MRHFMLQFLDYFFLAFHTSWTLFNIIGWAFRKTRKVHFVTMTLTFISWFVLGIWYGWGFCFCTDWHWQVREALGRPITSNSYIHFLIQDITGYDASLSLVDTLTLVVSLAGYMLTIAFNVWDFYNKKNPMRVG